VRRLFLIVAAGLVLAGPAAAVNPDEQMADPVLEARAQKLSQELRCVVCQNQTIDDSDAQLARDLRLLLRERLAAGDTDAEAKAYMVQRYGDFVLLRPPMKGSTLVLWFGPVAVLAVGAVGVAAYLRGRAKPAPEKLDAAEEAELAKLLTPDEAA
jgi:cytochrome c-type biogenesis protein CcmH